MSDHTPEELAALLTTPEACTARLREIRDEADRLERFDKPTKAQVLRSSLILDEFTAVDKRRRDLTRDAELEKVRTLAGGAAIERGTPYGGAYTPSSGSVRDQARRVLDGFVRSGELPAYGAERVEHLVMNGPQRDQDVTAQWAVATGDPAYLRAFAKVAADPERGHMLWDGEEQAAYRRTNEVQSLMRSMSLTDSAGGFLVPMTLEPAVLLTSDGSVNPLRQISRVVQTATDTWSGITSAGVSAEWTAEGAEVAAVDPALVQPTIPVHKGDAYLEYSFEVGMDAVNFLGEMQKLLMDAADQLNATAYTTGSGSGQPTGIVTALAGTASEINAISAETLTGADVYALQNALGSRWQPRAQWCANLAIINSLAQLETTNGALKFPGLQEVPATLLRKPMNEVSNMDGTVNGAVTASNYVMIYGDFQQFAIVDRIGSTLEFLPMVVGPNRRPTGQRGALLWWRTGSDALADGAFRMLDIPTTA